MFGVPKIKVKHISPIKTTKGFQYAKRHCDFLRGIKEFSITYYHS
jgi:hypothetical protein